MTIIRYKILIFLIFAIFRTANAQNTSLGWTQIPNSALQSLCPPNNYGNSGYPFFDTCRYVVGAWNSAVFDTKRNRLLIWGGGHLNYFGNELYAVNLVSFSTERVTDPAIPVASASSCDDSLANGTQPNSRHTYDSIAYMSNVDKMFIFGGSVAGCGYFKWDTWTFDLNTKTWQRMHPSGDAPSAVPGIVSAYDPITGNVFLHDDQYLYSFSYTTNTYRRLSTSNPIDYHMTAVIDPIDRKFVIIGTGHVYVYDIGENSTYSRQTLATTGGSQIVNSSYPGLTFDTSQNRIVAWNGGDTVYSLDLNSGTWSSATFAGGPGAAEATGTYKRWSYSPSSGVFVLVNSMLANIYTFRLGSSSPDTTPPTEPTALTAVATSSSQITLSWTPASDNVGVVGYRIYRNNALISSTITTNSYLDTALSPSTTYSYTVSASDAAGNISNQSLPTTVTTQSSPVTTQSIPAMGPVIISGISVANLYPTSASVTWTTNVPADSQIEFDTTPCPCSTNTALVSTLVTNHIISLSGLQPSTTYHFRVKSKDSSGNLTVSTDQYFTTAAASTTAVTSFQVTSATTGVLPFTVGLAFKKGDIPGVPVLSISESQVIVKSRWADNSVKHAIASGHVQLAAGVSNTITVFKADSSPVSTDLTATDIQRAAPSAYVQLGTIGSVNLSDLLGNPFRTWISGPEMVEAHYRSAVGSDPTLVVWFHVRLYKNGRIFIRAIVENGFLNVTAQNKSYIPQVVIGGATVYDNGGASLTHYYHTRWTSEGWIGGDPQITPRLDTAYLISTKLVPNYMNLTPSGSSLDNLYQTYKPYQNGNWTANMSDTGYQQHIGLLPVWDALYIISSGDARAFKSVIANTKALNSYPIVWTDSTTKLPPLPSNRPTWTVDGFNGGGETAVWAGSLTWDAAHHGSGGYLAYLITGDYYYLETMQHQSSLCYLINSSTQGSGTSRRLAGQTRATAWCQRTIGQLAAISPIDTISDDYRTLLANNATAWATVSHRAGQNLIGYLYAYEVGSGAYGTGLVAPWQQHFWIQTYGYLSDLEPLSDMSDLRDVRNYLYRAVVGILGSETTDEYCYTKAASYTVKVLSNTNPDSTTWYDSWGQVFQETYGTPNSSCGSTLQGSSGGDPANAATGYWGNLLPAIAYAVDHGAPGAAASWIRLTSASNWSVLQNSGFNNIPVWGIIPRDPAVRPKAPLNLRITP